MRSPVITLVLGIALICMTIPTTTAAVKKQHRQSGGDEEFLPVTMVIQASREAGKALLYEFMQKVGVTQNAAKEFLQKIIFGTLTMIDMMKKEYQKYIDGIIDSIAKAFPEGKAVGAKSGGSKGIMETCVTPKGKEVRDYLKDYFKICFDFLLAKKTTFLPLLTEMQNVYVVLVKLKGDVISVLAETKPMSILNENLDNIMKSIGTIVQVASEVEKSLLPDLKIVAEKKLAMKKKKYAILTYMGACTAAKVGLI